MASVIRPRWLLEAERLDRAVYDAIVEADTPSLDALLKRLATAADYSRLWLIASALLAAGRGAAGRRAACVGLASVAVTSAVVNAGMKPLGRRQRPDPADDAVPVARRVTMPRSRSFPSGHSASAFAFATGVGDVLPREATVLRGLAALVAYSRVHTGVHYPGDVLIGALVGDAIAQFAASRVGVGQAPEIV